MLFVLSFLLAVFTMLLQSFLSLLLLRRAPTLLIVADTDVTMQQVKVIVRCSFDQTFLGYCPFFYCMIVDVCDESNNDKNQPNHAVLDQSC
jgi:hypothetical protein